MLAATRISFQFKRQHYTILSAVRDPFYVNQDILTSAWHTRRVGKKQASHDHHQVSRFQLPPFI
eukprot:6317705-Ditylum_brightwellii.AAC.1